MAKTNPETIVLKGVPIYKEAEAGGTIKPGMLLERSAADTVVAHSTAGGTAGALFARENDIAGDDIDHDYASGEKVLMFHAFPGMEVYALLADGENASVGSYLESNGNGELRVVDADASTGDVSINSVVAVALEANDLSDSAADPTSEQRMKVEIV